MSKKSRDKGCRVERELVRILQDFGMAAERVPLSGACHGRYAGDISVPVLGEDMTLEVKARAKGFAQPYAWLEGADALIVKADRKEPLLVIPLKRAAEIIMRAEKAIAFREAAE
jgi:Holliday junction resolvase